MPFYEYEHIPGIDYLGRGIASDLSPKQLGSACAQLGKKKAITETFACCGWDVTPRELKRIAELQYVGGANMMCQHLYSYSAGSASAIIRRIIPSIIRGSLILPISTVISIISATHCHSARNM